LLGPVGTGAYRSDKTNGIESGSKVNRTHLILPNDNQFYNINVIDANSNSGGFKCLPTENLTKRYDRLVNDQGQLTKGVEKAFDSKGFPRLEAQAALNCYGRDKLAFTKEAIIELLYLLRTTVQQTYTLSNYPAYTIRIYDRKWMNNNTVPSSVNDSRQAFVSKAQNRDDLINQIGRIYFSNNDYVYLFAPLTDLDNMWNSSDYVIDLLESPTKQGMYGTPYFEMTHINMIHWLNRYMNNSNEQFVGYVSPLGRTNGTWGTILQAPTFTDVAGYNAYINDSTKFTPSNSTSFNFRFSEPSDEYNVQDIMTAYTYVAQKYGVYDTPYGAVNFTGSTGANQNVVTYTSPVWARIGYCLNYLEYENNNTTVFDISSVLTRNKLYHYVRYQMGLLLTGITKFFGSAENISILMNNPRTSTVAKTVYYNIFAMLNYQYFTPDGKTLYFIYPLAKTYSADYTGNLLYTMNGTYTPGTLFNNYNNVNITGPLASSTADLSYHVYLEDYQWWRGDLFDSLNEVKISMFTSAGSSLSLIKQAKDNNEIVELESSYYCSQGCDTIVIDLWSDSYGTTSTKKVRCINWNNTDTVVRFLQPLLFIWSGVVTSVKVGGYLSVPTANTFNPSIPYASYPFWASLAKNVNSGEV
jgi:hypothetical protein